MRKIDFEAMLICSIDQIVIDFCNCTIFIYVPEGCCTDMDGAICMSGYLMEECTGIMVYEKRLTLTEEMKFKLNKINAYQKRGRDWICTYDRPMSEPGAEE